MTTTTTIRETLERAKDVLRDVLKVIVASDLNHVQAMCIAMTAIEFGDASKATVDRVVNALELANRVQYHRLYSDQLLRELIEVLGEMRAL